MMMFIRLGLAGAMLALTFGGCRKQPDVAQSQSTCTSNNSTVAMTKCNGSNGEVPAEVRAQFNWKTNGDNTITITGYTGTGGVVNIPSTISGLVVTSIGNGAFLFCASLTRITIPNVVAEIKDGAFFRCTNLTEVYFRGSAPRLGDTVFRGDDNTTIYYQTGTTGWDKTFGGRPTAVWSAQGATHGEAR